MLRSSYRGAESIASTQDKKGLTRNQINTMLFNIPHKYSLNKKNLQSLGVGVQDVQIFKVYISIVFILISGFYLSGCKKIIEVNPPIQSIIGNEIYNSNTSAASVLTGIYASMSEGSFAHGLSGISFATGLTSDELTLFAGNTNPGFEFLYQNAPASELGNFFWSDLYGYIFRCNGAIEGINKSNGISDGLKQQLVGEAKFIRAFCYFYLVNLYGDVPLLTSTDPKINAIAARSDKTLIYQRIIDDLLEAQQLLNSNFVGADGITSTMERVRPTKYAATALLSRVYLYTEQWDKAESEAASLISNAFFALTPLEQVFLMNSTETIWSLQSRLPTSNNLDGIVFNFLDTDDGPNSNHPVYLSKSLLESFEPGDNRKNRWIDSVTTNGATYFYANKYKTDRASVSVTEYPMMLRLAEQYLIRAEARAQQGNIMGLNTAESDLNVIRARAALAGTMALTKEGMLSAILHERKHELVTEWGHRWLDLKRTGTIDAVMTEVAPGKGGVWSSFKALYPIPVYDIQVNPSLRGDQNPGYPEN
jgi:starch-binding outer membrane protein, SusD/RagB family